MAKPAKVPGLRPDTPTSRAGPLLVRARVQGVRRVAGAAAALDADGIHDMRVATRRLRAALRLFGGEEGRRLDAELRALQDALGAVRDAQVQLAWVEASAGRLSARERERLRSWLGEPDADLDEMGARAQAAIRAWAEEVAPRVEEAARAFGRRRKLGGKKMRAKLDKAERRLRRRVPAVLADPAPRPAHLLRIAAKKARYVAELLEQGFPAEVRPLLKRLVSLQETLGELHDADVRIERLRAAGRRGAASDRRLAARLVARLERERRRLAAELVSELEGSGAATASRRSRRAS